MSERKNNGTVEPKNVEETKVQQVETPVQPEPQVVVQVQQPVEQKNGGFFAWCKRHWKALAGAGAGAGLLVTSGVVAYKKGKAAGIMSVPMPQVEQDDYSLDPNVD